MSRDIRYISNFRFISPFYSNHEEAETDKDIDIYNIRV